MEKLRNMNVRQIVAAGLVLLGASAIMGCSESRDSSYQLLVECPDNTELEVLEVEDEVEEVEVLGVAVVEVEVEVDDVEVE